MNIKYNGLSFKLFERRRYQQNAIGFLDTAFTLREIKKFDIIISPQISPINPNNINAGGTIIIHKNIIPNTINNPVNTQTVIQPISQEMKESEPLISDENATEGGGVTFQ